MISRREEPRSSADGSSDAIELSKTSESSGDGTLAIHDITSLEQQSQSQQIDPPASPPPPPNGGFVAWTQCADAFLLWFAAWGLVNSFGVFQAYYTTTYLPTSSSSNISWIGSLQLCIFILGSSIVGPLYDMGYLRILLVVGTFFIFFGMLLTSFNNTYGGIILSQGLFMGLGMTCIFIPCVSVLPPYFSSRRALAMGVAATGSSIGAIVFTVIFQQLISKVGFGWTTRTMAFVLLASLILPLVTMRKRVPQSSRRAFIDPSALREPAFCLALASMFVVFMGLYVPYFYIEVFAMRESILEVGHKYLVKYLIVIMNVGSLVGRLLPNILADKIGPWNTIVPASLISGLIGFCWITVKSQAALLAFCFFYGFFSGSFVALVPVIWATLSPDPKLLGTRTGMQTVPMAAGLLIGNPIAGALVSGESFTGLQVFCGCTVVIGGMFLLAGRIVLGRSSGTWKA